MLPVPDLLHHEARLDVDFHQLHELFGLAFTGRGDAPGIDLALAAGSDASAGWQADHFAHDLFVGELVRDHFRIRLDDKLYAVNEAFHFRVLTSPPEDLDTIHMRQGILRELAENPALRQATGSLYVRLYDMVNMFKVPGRLARLDIDTFRIDLFRLVKESIDQMATDFAGARSELRRVAEVARKIQKSEPYEILQALLDYASRRASLQIDLQVGATGKITRLDVKSVQFDTENPFFQSTLQRFAQKLRAVIWHGFQLHDETIMSRLVQGVYDRWATSLMGLGQLLGQFELYLAMLQLESRCRSQGLAMCLPSIRPQGSLELRDLFNPLLADGARRPIPCTIQRSDSRAVTLVTGPNSGGKTRLLQSLGLAQLMGQNGLYVAAAEAHLTLVRGMFVSLIEHEAVEHSEGRLGRELERIRAMFATMQPPSMIILDELCSGTNPSEGEEVFSLVLRLLDEALPVGFITTHFLDYARRLEASPPIDALRFLQVEMDPDRRSTYQFVPGVADSSLAGLMAERMGITFDQIADELRRRDPSALPARSLGGQAEAKSGTPIQAVGLGPNGATVHLDHFLDQGEPKTRAADVGVDPAVQLENVI